MSDFCSLLQSISKLCSLCPTFCGFLQSISKLCSPQLTFVVYHCLFPFQGIHLPFLVNFSHNTIIVALSFSFLNVVKSCYLVLFLWRKMQKKRKKMRHFSKSFTSYLHNESNSEHNSTRFGKLQCRATTFVLTIFGN